MAPLSSTLAWKIPWTEEPGRLQSMGSLRVRYDWETSRSVFTFMHWRRKWQPTPVFFLENPRDGGAWWAAVYGAAQSRTGLKRLSSSSRHQNTNRNANSWRREIISQPFFFFFASGYLPVRPFQMAQYPCRRLGFDPWIREISWRGKWQSTPVFLPGKSYE